MKKIFVLLISMLIGSCSIPVDFCLFNNTSIDQAVFIQGKSIEISPGDYEYIAAVENRTFEIVSNGVSRSYTVPSFPISEIVWVGWGPFAKRIFYAQLESDGKIWVTSSKDRSQDFKQQPDGFPLEPHT